MVENIVFFYEEQNGFPRGKYFIIPFDNDAEKRREKKRSKLSKKSQNKFFFHNFIVIY